jgi:hypothetical protein
MPGKLRYNLIGRRFSNLTVVRYHGFREGIVGRNYWECLCDCGETTLVDSFSLRRGRIHSCGCAKVKYHVGDIIGEFVLLERSDDGVTFNARCSCGKTTNVQPGALLQRNNTPMCRACTARRFKRKDITGKVFGRLTALECAGTDKHRNAIWKFRCTCGNEVHRRINEIQKPRVRGAHSCGKCTHLYQTKDDVRSHEHRIAKE